MGMKEFKYIFAGFSVLAISVLCIAATPAGTYAITITGTGGEGTKTCTYTLTVT
jgi:hypothetical protein